MDLKGIVDYLSEQATYGVLEEIQRSGGCLEGKVILEVSIPMKQLLKDLSVRNEERMDTDAVLNGLRGFAKQYTLWYYDQIRGFVFHMNLREILRVGSYEYPAEVF